MAGSDAAYLLVVTHQPTSVGSRVVFLASVLGAAAILMIAASVSASLPARRQLVIGAGTSVCSVGVLALPSIGILFLVCGAMALAAASTLPDRSPFDGLAVGAALTTIIAGTVLTSV